MWPWIKDIDIYRCPRGLKDHAATYSIVISANGTPVEGTYTGGSVATWLGVREGNTVLRFSKLTDLVSPSAGQRAVFIDKGYTPAGNDFYVHYLYPNWKVHSPPPKQHNNGVTISMADGHVEYWRWKGPETVKMSRKLVPAGSRYPNIYLEVLEGGDYKPKTEKGMYDLQRLQKATWGRLGYTLDNGSQ